MNARTFFEGCGMGIGLTLSYTWEPLAPNHIEGLYLRALPVSTVAAGAAFDLAAASLGCWGLLALIERFDEDRSSLIWSVLAAAVTALLLRSALSLSEVNFRVPSALLITAALLILPLVTWRSFPTAYRGLVNGFRLIYLCLGISILWMLPTLAYDALLPQPRDLLQSDRRLPATHSQLQGWAARPRIVWILLDELSYDQTFDHRQRGLSLPALDALRTQSTSFADVQPAGYYTDQIVPALLSGRPVFSIRSSQEGALSVRETSSTAWRRFNPYSTLFADAERMGWSTGIAGWFNPYCRLFASVVDSCYWIPESRMFPGHMSNTYTPWQNAIAPLRTKFGRNANESMAGEHRAAYSLLLEHALVLLDDPQLCFVFLHFPVPHPPGIYDRSTGRLRKGGSYLDNLVLADATLRVLRAAIDQTPEAAHTTLIVSSDHSMRVLKWRGGQYWTREDEETFHGHFDPRPVLLIHFPGESSASTIRAPFDELKTHAILEEMLAHQIHSQADLTDWLGRNMAN